MPANLLNLPKRQLVFLVLSLGDLQVECGTFAVHHDCSRIEELLPGAVVASKTAHHAEGEVELHRQRARAVGKMDYAAEADAIKVRIRDKVVQHRTHEMRNMFVEGQRCQLVARTRCWRVQTRGDR